MKFLEEEFEELRTDLNKYYVFTAAHFTDNTRIKMLSETIKSVRKSIPNSIHCISYSLAEDIEVSWEENKYLRVFEQSKKTRQFDHLAFLINKLKNEIEIL